jgi:hypothetical protein
MKDSFEQFFEVNHDAFDSQMPSDALWDKIAAEADIKERNNKVLFIKWLKTSAAVGIVVILTTIGWQLLNRSQQQQTLSPFQAQLNEATQYYENEINTKTSMVLELTANQPDVRQNVTEDLAGLDSAMVQLKNDLKDNVSNAEVLEAMIQNYRLKLQILEQILSYVKPDGTEEQGDDTINNETHEL